MNLSMTIVRRGEFVTPVSEAALQRGHGPPYNRSRMPRIGVRGDILRLPWRNNSPSVLRANLREMCEIGYLIIFCPDLSRYGVRGKIFLFFWPIARLCMRKMCDVDKFSQQLSGSSYQGGIPPGGWFIFCPQISPIFTDF